MSDIAEHFIFRGRDKSEFDYGSGVKFNTVEMHFLTGIANNPGITITQLAEEWGRTKGAISQIVKKLEEKGYIYKEKSDENYKITKLFVTDEGMVHVKAHLEYDKISAIATIGVLLEHFSPEEMNTFYRIMSVYNRVKYYSELPVTEEERQILIKLSVRKAIEDVFGKE